ncbi:MAG TPA: sulfotransferase [Rhizomicrobium sp.]
MTMAVQPATGLSNYLKLAEASLRAGEILRAQKIAREASERGFEHPNLLVLAAYEYINAKDYDRALTLAGRACELAPRSADALSVLGYCLTLVNRHAEAVTTLDKALRLTPAFAQAHFHKGLALERMGEVARARRQYVRAADLDPRHASALGRSAYLAALQGDMREASQLGNRALAVDRANVYGALGVSLVEIDAGEPRKAIARLQPIATDAGVDATVRSVAFGVMADAEDELGRKAEAFSLYQACGEVLRKAYPPDQRETALPRVQRLTRYFQTTSQQGWRQSAPAPSPVRTHAFLLGFPRSGTTLLEQVLAAHPDIEAMEERDCLIQSYPFLASDETLNRFAAMGPDDLAPLRQSYWDEARKAGMELSRPVFVDKMPLNSVPLCLIARLFPDSKIVFALRDPRDVVFSCFRRRFGMTQQMFELLTLESAATYYNAVMTLCDIYRGRLALSIMDVRYESLVEGFEAVSRNLCAFLDVPYRREMHDFVAAAQSRDIDTPSAAQIVKGLYSRGIGQWRNYRAQMKPVLPGLAPWVDRFGYGEN